MQTLWRFVPFFGYSKSAHRRLQLDPELLIGFLPDFEAYYHRLAQNKTRTEEETNVMESVRVLVDCIHKEYKRTLYRIKSLISHGEITSDLLYAIMVPRTTLITKCPVTGEPRALQCDCSLIH